MSIAGASFPKAELGVIAVTLASALAAGLILARTKLGLGLRAVADTVDEARLAGVRAPVLLSVGWGLSASVFMNAGRTLAQNAAPATHRGRVLSVYALGFMGSAPIGALLSGFLAGAVGPLATCALCAATMTVLATAAALRSGVAALE